MTLEQKGKLIGAIMRALKTAAQLQKKEFREGETWLALAFKTDAELKRIASLAFGERHD